jgi:hypothetical protein
MGRSPFELPVFMLLTPYGVLIEPFSFLFCYRIADSGVNVNIPGETV